MFCTQCKRETVSHKEMNMKRKYRKVGAKGTRKAILSKVSNFYEEKDNVRKDLKFLTVNSRLPTVAEMKSSLDQSTFFRKFEAKNVDRYPKPFRSKTAPRERYEELYSTELKDPSKRNKAYQIQRGKLGRFTIYKSMNYDTFDNTFRRLLAEELEFYHLKVNPGQFDGGTDEYSRPVGVEMSLLNHVYLEHFEIQTGGYEVFDCGKN